MFPTPKTTIAIYHLPWELVIESEEPFEFSIKKRQDFALYSALHSLAPNRDVTYIGILADLPTILTDFDLKRIKERLLEPPYNSVVVFPSTTILEGHKSYSSLILQPLLHYVISNDILSKPEENSSTWDAFVKLNSLFANAIESIFKRGDIVWIIDFDLILVPNMIYNLKKGAVLGYFHYAPFPSSEILRCLPQRKEIISGLLGSTLVGFQHYSYASHFLSCCTRILGLETFLTGINNDGQTLSVGIFPTGVKLDDIEELLNSTEVKKQRISLRESFSSKKVLIGYEISSQINGVLHKIRAFEKFIESYPELAANTVLIQITPNSNSAESTKIEDKIYELVSKVNAKYGSIDHLPIQYFTQQFEREKYLATLAEADACLITPERDSTNDMAFEYVLCQKDHRNPLIISELVGNVANFTTALHVNPWDYQGVADTICKALVMSEKEKNYRFDQLYKKVLTCNINDWGSIFLGELEDLSSNASHPVVVPLDISKVISEYLSSQERLFMLDYDGTLVDIQSVPSEASPSQKSLDILLGLTKDPKNRVFIISGRDQNTLDEWLGNIEKLGFSAEHGCFFKLPGKAWINQVETIEQSWKQDILAVFEYYTERTPGSFIEHKRSSITWHYRLADPDYGSWQANECLNHLESLVTGKGELEVMPGKKNLEVRPKLINKGEVVTRLCQLYPDVDFITCIGDDKTDEDMFKSLKKIGKHCLGSTFSCTVSPTPEITQAKYFLRSPDDVLDLLQSLVKHSS